MKLPTLFKKTSTGKIQRWDVAVVVNDESGLPEILTSYGYIDGEIQATSDVIKSGKNLGKSNETTPLEQAKLEATSKWESKLKDGYVKSIEDAESGKVDEIVEGGVEPMLAQSFEKHGGKITFPCFVQPKLDGIRCIAVKQGDSVSLWSRSRKRITSCPHIENHIAFAFRFVDSIVLDGELYNHDLKHDFEKIISAVRKEDPSPESEKVEYHIYDTISEYDFYKRSATILTTDVLNTSLKLVDTVKCEDEEDLQYFFKKYKKEGYEGAMARNVHGAYEFKRSYNLQKVKEFDDAEFEIIGVQEGKGKLRGLVGAFVCKTTDGTEFEAKPKGNQTETKKYLEDESTWRGKRLVVQFQGLTGKNKVPRFPVGLRLKDPIEG